MESGFKKALTIWLVALCPVSLNGEPVGKVHAKQNLVCCGDAPFDHAVRLPKDFVNAWTGSQMASGLRAMLRDDPHFAVEKFYTAYRVRLTSSNDLAYIVEGAGKTL